MAAQGLDRLPQALFHFCPQSFHAPTQLARAGKPASRAKMKFALRTNLANRAGPKYALPQMYRDKRCNSALNLRQPAADRLGVSDRNICKGHVLVSRSQQIGGYQQSTNKIGGCPALKRTCLNGSPLFCSR